LEKAAMNPVYRKRLLMHRVGIALSVAAMSVGLLVLAWILITLIIKGFGALSLNLFTQTRRRQAARAVA
jgi:phosphate transport system permease protein